MSAPVFHIERATAESRVALVFAIAGLIALAAGPWWLDRNGMRLAGEFFVYLGLATLWNLFGRLRRAGFGWPAGICRIWRLFSVRLGDAFGPAAIAGRACRWCCSGCTVVAYLASGIPIEGRVLRYRHLGRGRSIHALAAQISVLGGGSGVSLPISLIRAIGSTRSMREYVIYYETVGVTVAIILAVYLLLRSRWGLALQAIRDSELAAETAGVSVANAKRLLYVVACVWRGDDRCIDLHDQVADFAVGSFQCQRLDSIRHLHHGDRRNRAYRRSDYRYDPVLCSA